METKDQGKTSMGMEANVAAALCYSAGFVTGIIFYVIEKDNKFVRFHAMQSIVVFGAITALQIVDLSLLFFMPWMLRHMISTVVSLAGLILWILLILKAYQGEYLKLPIVGDIAEKNS